MTRTRQVGNLPAESASFVGRRTEAAAIKRLLAQSRIVTLVGLGGVGKTRLALQTATNLSKAYPDGVWFIELGSVQDAHTLSHTMAQTLGIRDLSGRDMMSVIIDYLHHKQCLLVMDNCEQIIDECARLVHIVTTSLPNVQILATSREALGVPQEALLEVLPFSLPSEVDSTHSASSDAVTLFAQRAAAASADFSITPENQQIIEAVCRRLEGIPLAIELAAVRTRSLSPEQLLSRLDNRFRLLSGGGRGVPDRHHTLRAAVDWSYGLCTDEERILWARLSVFRDSFDLEAVESVCADGRLDRDIILDVLSGLIEKSIVRRTFPSASQVETRARYHLLDTLREYGNERLTSDENEALHRRHFEWYARFSHEGAGLWFGPRQREWHQLALSDKANIRAALAFCLNDSDFVQAGLKMAGDLWWYWAPGGFMAEGRQWLERLLAQDDKETRSRGEALWVCSWIASHQGDIDSAGEKAQRSREIAERLGDNRLITYSMQAEAVKELSRGDADRAIPQCQEAWDRHCTQGEITGPATMALVQLAILHCSKGNLEEATAKSTECLRITREHKENWTRSWALVALGLSLFLSGDVKASADRLSEAIQIKAEFSDLFGLAMAVEFLSWARSDEGNHHDAAIMFGGLEPLWAFTGVTLMGSPQLLEIRAVRQADTERALGSQVFSTLVQEGREMRVGETVSYILRQKGESKEVLKAVDNEPPSSLRSLLTRREFEVAKLITQGLSNKEIAAKLIIAPRTAEAHVAHIMTKLNCSSRSAVAAALKDLDPSNTHHSGASIN